MVSHKNLLFTTSYDKTIICWNLKTGDDVRTFRGHFNSVGPISYLDLEGDDGKTEVDLEDTTDVIITGLLRHINIIAPIV